MDLSEAEAGFVAQGVPQEIAHRLLAEYAEAKRRFHLGDHQPTAVEGGRFADAGLRMLEHALFGTHTPFSKNLAQFNQTRLANFESATSPFESLRIHIPRALYSVYAVRNKRDAAHLNDGISANLQDATYVVAVLDWVLAEFVRIYHQVSPAEAQSIINDLVVREVPVIEELDGQPICSKDLSVTDLALVYLYRAGQGGGLSIPELQRQMRHGHRGNLTTMLKKLDQRGLVLIHPVTGRVYITRPGLAAVEHGRLLDPAS